MPEKMFLKDNRYDRRAGRPDTEHKYPKVILILFAVVILTTALFFATDRYIEKKIYAAVGEFDSLCTEHQYEEAMQLYRKIKEKALDTGFFRIKTAENKEVLEVIENRISEMIAEIFSDISVRGKKATSYQISMMNAFSEITIREINESYYRYLTECISGMHSEQQAYYVLYELMKTEILSDSLEIFRKQIPEIIAYTVRMNTIKDYYAADRYIDLLTAIHADIDGNEGFIREYLTKYLKEIDDEIFTQLISDVDVMMSRGKYYSAEALIKSITPFYTGKAELGSRTEVCAEYTDKELVEYTLPVEHISVRPLISDRNFRFGKDEYALTAEDLMLTADEFLKILEGLYDNSYILIDINSLVGNDGRYIPVMIPAGRKPLILSVEGLNYYASRRLSGNSTGLTVDEKGNVVSEYKGPSGETIIDRNGEVIGILEQFIEKYPDFSFDGAKGNISLTGFECIFGFVINRDQAEDRAENYIRYGLGNFSISDSLISESVNSAIKVIDALKNNGWTFSTSTYGNISVGEVTLDALTEDNKKWKDQIGALVGKTRVMLFPNGSVVSSKDPRGQYLISQGYIIQCGIGPSAYFNQGEKHLFMDRIALNGTALRKYDLSRFFDTAEVYDKARIRKIG